MFAGGNSTRRPVAVDVMIKPCFIISRGQAPQKKISASTAPFAYRSGDFEGVVNS
jgi:hypothetical protein